MAKLRRYKDFVDESRAQLTLPFKETEYKGKSVHGHLADALEDLQSGKVGSYYSKGDPEAEIDKVVEAALKQLLESDDEQVKQYIYRYVNAYDPFDKDNKAKYKPAALKELRDNKEDFNNDDTWGATEYIHDNINLENLFSKDGWSEFMDMSADQMSEDISEMRGTVQDAYNKDEDGLIDCWRTVDYTKGDEKDIYLAITKQYGGVGVYWAWDEDKAEAYWGDSKGHSITLHGKVSVENVDWHETVYRSAYGLNEEREIRIKDAGDIMIVGYHDDVIDKYIELEEPVVVKTSKGTIKDAE